jgi:hypothetical protein
MRFFDPAQDFEAVHVGHHDIQDHHIVRILLDLAQRLPTVLHGLDLEVIAGENTQAASNDDLFVVDDENSRAH